MTSPERRHRRAESLTSRRFYQTENVDQKFISLIETCESTKPKTIKIKQSKHLPYWAWFLFAKINGVPLKPKDRPICGVFLHILTFICAFIFAGTYTWYIVYDILSPNTSRDIPGGTVGIFLVYYWCGFGYYCKTLLSRLFFHERFLKDVRMHSRTVFKINASFLALLLGTLFSAANIYETFRAYIFKNPCEEINLDEIFCNVLAYSSIAFTIFVLLWHTLVSFVFISVCRTHTIGLRCFSQELEHDASVLQSRHSTLYKKFPLSNGYSTPISNWNSSDEEDNLQSCNKSIQTNQVEQNQNQIGTDHRRFTDSDEIGILLSPVADNLLNSTEEFTASGEVMVTGPQSQELVNVVGNDCMPPLQESLSPTEILNNFWKINRRLRFSASALQRWYASFITLVLLRCSTYLVYWLTHVASIFDVLQFILPLLLLVLLSTALAEVNFEGQRFLRSVFPTTDRLKMLQYLSMNPLQMPIYGFGMTHGTIVTVIFAILVGFVTRIVITELTK